MIEEFLGITTEKLIRSGWETLYMVGLSLVIGSVLGSVISITLWLTRKGGLRQNVIVYTILNGVININKKCSVYYSSGICNAVYKVGCGNEDRNKGGSCSISYLHSAVSGKTGGKFSSGSGKRHY